MFSPAVFISLKRYIVPCAGPAILTEVFVGRTLTLASSVFPTLAEQEHVRGTAGVGQLASFWTREREGVL